MCFYWGIRFLELPANPSLWTKILVIDILCFLTFLISLNTYLLVLFCSHSRTVENKLSDSVFSTSLLCTGGFWPFIDNLRLSCFYPQYKSGICLSLPFPQSCSMLARNIACHLLSWHSSSAFKSFYFCMTKFHFYFPVHFWIAESSPIVFSTFTLLEILEVHTKAVALNYMLKSRWSSTLMAIRLNMVSYCFKRIQWCQGKSATSSQWHPYGSPRTTWASWSVPRPALREKWSELLAIYIPGQGRAPPALAFGLLDIWICAGKGPHWKIAHHCSSRFIDSNPSQPLQPWCMVQPSFHLIIFVWYFCKLLPSSPSTTPTNRFT